MGEGEGRGQNVYMGLVSPCIGKVLQLRHRNIDDESAYKNIAMILQSSSC